MKRLSKESFLPDFISNSIHYKELQDMPIKEVLERRDDVQKKLAPELDRRCPRQKERSSV